MKQDSSKVQMVNVNQKLSLFSKYWSPKIIGELNDHKVQAVKLKGEFVWHHHEKTEKTVENQDKI
ncbi:MAG: oxygenase [Candidatus Curtissbacteria bacterium]|nr:oxygenase [Candidatus Curtissbacteria bacterium]